MGWGILLPTTGPAGEVFLTDCPLEPFDCTDGTGPATPAPIAELSFRPDGLGIPALRTTDVTFPQRDGIRMGGDWYENRVLTFEDVTVCPEDGCVTCGTVPRRWRDLASAWSRHCGLTELVIFTDCHGQPDPATGEVDRSLTGPFGVIGRPRAMVDTTPRSASGCRQATLRFDAVDHRLYILDECGTPGSGEVCADLEPGLPPLGELCIDATNGLCFTSGPDGGQICFTAPPDESPSGGETVPIDNIGTECACPTITLTGMLTNPAVENVTTGARIDYDAVIEEGQTIIINTADGTATTDTGADRTSFLSGDTTGFCLPSGVNQVRLLSFGAGDNGTAEVCIRPSVLVAA